MFPALFANQILICFILAAHVSPVLFPLHLRCVGWLWTGDCSDFFVSGTVCEIDIDLFNVISTCPLGLPCSIILVQWLHLWTTHRLNTSIFHLGSDYLHHFRQSLPYFVCFWFEEYGVQSHSRRAFVNKSHFVFWINKPLYKSKWNVRPATSTAQNCVCWNVSLYIKKKIFEFLRPQIFSMKTNKWIKPFSILKNIPLSKLYKSK